MQNEIPAGTQVKVAVTQKGVTTLEDAEVLAHMDGLVHVNMHGDAVSVDPSQIVTGDASAAPAPPVQEGAPAAQDNSGNNKIVADLIAQLTARVTALEGQFKDGWNAVCGVESRVTVLEAATPKPIDAAAPAAQSSTTDEKGAASPASAEPAGEAPAGGPEATAGATGQ